MAISQPVSSDLLSSPDHSLMHRQIATDPAAPVQSLTIPASGNLAGTCLNNTNPTNLLYNGDFEAWTGGTAVAPDGWVLTGGAVAREGTIIKIGAYSTKLTRSGSDMYLYIYPKWSTYYRNRTLIFGCWVYATVANRARFALGDDQYTSYSSYHTGSSAWEWLTVTYTVDAIAIILAVYLRVDNGNTDAYFDGAMCVEGESAFAFSPKPAEEGVWTDYSATSTIVGWSSFTTKKIYVKKIGKIVFCAFSIGGTSNSTSASFTVPYTSASTGPIETAIRTQDNGGTAVTGLLDIGVSSTTVDLFPTMAAGVWANSGTKSIWGQFWYESA
jgi:hypothetical protein